MAAIKAIEDSSKYVEQLRDWLNKQPHLPKDLDDNLLLRFAHSCYYDVEKAKRTVDMFFTIRGTCSDLLVNRDPMSTHMQKILKIINLGQYSISGNRCLWAWQINDPGLDTYEYILDAKLFFLSTDSYFLDNDNLPEADIVIMDVKDISLKFITKFNVSIARKLSKYQEEAIPIRLKQVHIVNAPPSIDKIYGMLKPFMKKEITELIYFHPPKSETLYQYIDKEDLPADFGGSRPPMAELTKTAIALLMKKREKLIDENLWRVPDKKKNSEASTEVGSFRTLAID